MIARGDWWAPYYNGQPFFDKPMLFHQLQGIAMLAVGQNELGARLVPAVAALGVIAITFLFATAMTERAVGIVASLLMASNIGVFALARYAILDTLFTMFTFGGAAALTVAALGDRRRLQWVGYIAIALGVLTKGPLALVLCGLTLLIAAALSADARRRLLGLNWIAGLAVVIVLAAPWFVYMYARFGQAFVDGYLLDENIRLFASNRFANQPGAFFYVRILATGMLPWTGLLAGRLIDDIRAVVPGERLDTLEILLWSWTAAVVGFFSLSTFKLDHYVFPAAPALCILCARAWNDLRTGDHRRHLASRIGVQLVGPFLVAAGLFVMYLLTTRLDLPRGALLVPSTLMLCGVAMGLFLQMRDVHPARVPWLVTIAMIVTYGGVIAFVVPTIEGRKVVADLGRWTSSHAQAADRIATFRLNRWNPSFRFYVDRQATFLDDADEAAAFFAAPQPFYCAMLRDGYDALVSKGVPLMVVYERAGIWATSGRALWRESGDSARFVVVAPRR